METKHMTAFQTTRGLFQFKVIPFGMVNSGAGFSRMMRKVLKVLQNVDNFVDDILIFTDTFSQHVKVFDQVLDRFAGARLTAKPSTCLIGYRQLECLGHTLGQGKLLPGTDKSEAVKKAYKPETKKQVKIILGLANFYRKFVPSFAHIAHPLTELTKKGEPNREKWCPQQEQTFVKLKSALTSQPILMLPDFESIFFAQTDASDRGLGAVLLELENDVRLPVVFTNRKLSKGEK